MSWGERSCKKPCRIVEKSTPSNCNVDCKGYIWDGETPPDSVSRSSVTSYDNPIKSGKIEEVAADPWWLKKTKKKKKNKKVVNKMVEEITPSDVGSLDVEEILQEYNSEEGAADVPID